MKKKIYLSLIIFTLGVLGYVFLGSNGKQDATYLTEEVTRGDIEKTVVATGSIESINEVDVGAQVSGKITKLM